MTEILELPGFVEIHPHLHNAIVPSMERGRIEAELMDADNKITALDLKEDISTKPTKSARSGNFFEEVFSPLIEVTAKENAHGEYIIAANYAKLYSYIGGEAHKIAKDVMSVIKEHIPKESKDIYTNKIDNAVELAVPVFQTRHESGIAPELLAMDLMRVNVQWEKFNAELTKHTEKHGQHRLQAQQNAIERN